MNENYFEWMTGVLGHGWKGVGYFHSLLRYLNETPFIVDEGYEMDENREIDGQQLRMKYLYDISRDDDPHMLKWVATPGCSMLEMMLALCWRIDEEYLYDEAYGRREGQWFYEMLCSLGINDCDDENFNGGEVSHALGRMLTHRFNADGYGSLFYIPGCMVDLRDKEIWDQMNWWITMM